MRAALATRILVLSVSTRRRAPEAPQEQLTRLGAMNDVVRPLDGLVLRDVHQGVDLDITHGFHRI